MEPVKVSVIIPCYNEEGTIEELLNAILAQTYPVDRLEVIIADGLSTDRTRERITNFKAGHPQLTLKVVENHQRTIPAALNQAIAASTGEVLSRMDAHAIPAPDYIEKCLAALLAGFGENTGGVIDIRHGSDTWIGRAIAVATAHPLGVGDAHYRTATKAGITDTVAFGTYRRELVERIGGYDETLRINEDYEFNTRVRRAGGKILVDPAIRVAYYSRPDLRSLAATALTPVLPSQSWISAIKASASFSATSSAAKRKASRSQSSGPAAGVSFRIMSSHRAMCGSGSRKAARRSSRQPCS